MPSENEQRFPVTGWLKAMGVEFVSAEPDRVVLSCAVSEQHLQPYGLVHGGVHAGLVETACSFGAQLRAPPGTQVVGVENHTSFLRPVTTGHLTTDAQPLHSGRRAQLWEANITDGEGRLVATGRLRIFNIPAP